VENAWRHAPELVTSHKTVVTLSTRPATLSDIAQIVELSMVDAQRRRALNPTLWRVAANAREAVESATRAGLQRQNPAARQFWLLAEASGRSVGLAHAVVVPVPPIYNPPTGSPGLLLDDCMTTEDAPSGTAEALLLATEAAIRDAGAPPLLASCPSDGRWRSLLQRHGYKPVTSYMAKTGFEGRGLRHAVRPARPKDVPGIVAASAAHRQTLAQLNSRFWNIHPDADARFDRWMRHSLTLTDRDMFVSGAPDALHGYIIAQPIAPLLIPSAHDINAIGVIDDFYDSDFADAGQLANVGSAAMDLLAAAESAFARRDVDTALVVCPAAWDSKISILEQNGYQTAKLWMFKG